MRLTIKPGRIPFLMAGLQTFQNQTVVLKSGQFFLSYISSLHTQKVSNITNLASKSVQVWKTRSKDCGT